VRAHNFARRHPSWQPLLEPAGEDASLDNSETIFLARTASSSAASMRGRASFSELVDTVTYLGQELHKVAQY
jgi:hypothetical protein